MVDRHWMELMFVSCSEAAAERGWHIWRQRQVDAIRYRSDKAATQVLDRGAMHLVMLDTKRPASSRCDCGTEMCAHVMAAAIELLIKSGFTQQTIWRTFTSLRNTERNASGALPQAGSSPRSAAIAAGPADGIFSGDDGIFSAHDEVRKLVRPTVGGHDTDTAHAWTADDGDAAEDAEAAHAPTASGGGLMDRWFHMMDPVWRRFANVSVRQRFEQYREMIRRLGDSAHPDPVMRDLFRIAATLYPIRQWIGSVQEGGAGYSYARASEAMHQLDIGYDEVTRILEPYNGHWERFRAEPYEAALDALADFLYRCVFAGRGLDKWFYLYQVLWGTILNAPARVRRERERLARLLESDELLRSAAALARKAMGHFAVMDGRDEEAWRWFDASGHFPFAQGALYLRTFKSRRENERFVSWLSWYEERIVREHRDELPDYLNSWMYARTLGFSDACLAAMRRMLPYSYSYYESILREEFRGKEWVELHMALKLPPLGMEPERWKMWEERQPEWLLPWFHQAVEQSVSRKNREGYRQAVRYLKKLRQLYARLDKRRQWEIYMEKLIHRYKRMRLFQTELQKGILA